MGYSENIKGFFCDHCGRYWGTAAIRAAIEAEKGQSE